MLDTVMLVSPMELNLKLLDVSDGIGVHLSLAGDTGAVCLVTTGCQSIDI